MEIGDRKFTITYIAQEELDDYLDMVGDCNSIHNKIIPGALTSGIIIGLVGTNYSGAILGTQSFKYLKAIEVSECITACIKLTKIKGDWITFKGEITRDNELCVTGEIIVKYSQEGRVG